MATKPVVIKPVKGYILYMLILNILNICLCVLYFSCIIICVLQYYWYLAPCEVGEAIDVDLLHGS